MWPNPMRRYATTPQQGSKGLALTRSEPQQQRADAAAPAAVRDREAHRDHRRADVAQDHQPHHVLAILCDQPEIALLHVPRQAVPDRR